MRSRRGAILKEEDIDIMANAGNNHKLTMAELAAAKCLPVEFLSNLGVRDSPRGVLIPFYDWPNGECVAEKTRTALNARDGSFWPKGLPLAAYGLWRLEDARKASFLILVEGESDCWALWHHELPALGLPGSNTTKTLTADAVEDLGTIYVHQEPDQGGQAFVRCVLARLKELKYAGKVFVFQIPEGIKDPADLHVADPELFLERMETVIGATRSGADWNRKRDQATGCNGTPPQGKNPQLAKHLLDIAKECRDAGIELAQARERMRAFNVGSRPLPESEVNRITELAYREPAGGRAAPARASKLPRILEPYRPFPVDALPPLVAAYVEQGAKALGCDPAYLALPALAVLASAIGNTRTIQLKRGWEEPAVVWSVIVGDSGTLKSPAYIKVVGHLFALQHRAMERFKQEMKEYRQAKRKAKENGNSDVPDEPTLKRLVCSDTTIEKLAELLEDNPRGLLVARDELAGWLGSFERYKGKAGGTDRPNWLEMHRAGTIAVDRKTGERRTIFVRHAAVSVTGGIQPGVLARSLTADSIEAGLGARLLMAAPPKLPKRWSEMEVEPDVQQGYERLLDGLLALDFDTDRDGERVPQVLQLSKEAKAVWVTFYNQWASEQAAVEGEVAAAFSKLEAYAARFALLHHVATHVGLDSEDRREIGVKSIEAGVRLCLWFAGESRRIYATLSESPAERDDRRLIEFIASRGRRITARELQRSNNRKYPAVAPAEEALNALVQANLGSWEDGGTTPKGGHPTRVFVLCTTHDRTSLVGANGDQGMHDITADTTPGIPEKLDVSVGSVSCVMRRADTGTTEGERSGLCHAQEEASGGSVVQGQQSEEVEEGYFE